MSDLCWQSKLSMTRATIALLSVLTLLVFVGCRARQKTPDEAAAAMPEKRGYITGRALLADAAPGGHLGILVYLAGTSYNAHTDENGAYTIADLPAGTYTIVAERQGYQTATVDRVELDPTIHTREQPYIARTAILERLGSPLTTNSAAMLPQRRLGSLLGYVTLVDAPRNDGVLVRLQGTPLVTVTDEAGVYRFVNVEQGAYRITFEKPGYQSVAIDAVIVGGEETKADSVLMEPEQSAQERFATAPITRAELSGDRMILGRVRLFDASGNEISEFSRVTLALDNSDYIVAPDENGRFEFARLPAGLYTVLASLDGALPRSYLADLRDKKVVELAIDLTPPPAEKPTPGSVKGKVVLEGETPDQPADPTGVQVALAGTRLISATGSDGAFLIEQVPPGTYVVTATREGYEPARLEAVDVQPGQTVDVGTIQLELKRDYPRVIWTDPPDGARNVMVSYELIVKIKFSKPMDTASVEKAIVMEPQPVYTFHMGTGSHPAADDRTAVLVFSNDDDTRPIRFNTRYQITVGRGATDQTGLAMKQDYTFAFVTGAPGIMRTSPRDGAVDARVNGQNMPISVFFNTRIRTETFNLNSVKIRPRLDVDPNIVFDADPKTGWTVARIFADLEGGKEYTVTIDRSVRTSTNQPLSNTPYTFRFRTLKIEREFVVPGRMR
ncbi:MAG: carboxypeptidase regulatory-like domain-containing protein [Candidatus Sumerlaeaceae bacterium]